MEQFLRCDANELEGVRRWIEHADASSPTPRVVSALSMSSSLYINDLEASTAATAGAAYSEIGREQISYPSTDGDSSAVDSKSILPKVPKSLFCIWVLNYVRDETRELLAEQAQSANSGGQLTRHVSAGTPPSDASRGVGIQLPSSPSFHDCKPEPAIITSPSKDKSSEKTFLSPAAAWPSLGSSMGASSDKPKRRIRTTLLSAGTTTATAAVAAGKIRPAPTTTAPQARSPASSTSFSNQLEKVPGMMNKIMSSRSRGGANADTNPKHDVTPIEVNPRSSSSPVCSASKSSFGEGLVPTSAAKTFSEANHDSEDDEETHHELAAAAAATVTKVSLASHAQNLICVEENTDTGQERVFTPINSSADKFPTPGSPSTGIESSSRTPESGDHDTGDKSLSSRRRGREYRSPTLALSPFDDIPTSTRGVTNSSNSGWRTPPPWQESGARRDAKATRRSLDKLIGFPQSLKALAGIYACIVRSQRAPSFLTELHLLSRLLGINPEIGRLRALEWLEHHRSQEQQQEQGQPFSQQGTPVSFSHESQDSEDTVLFMGSPPSGIVSGLPGETSTNGGTTVIANATKTGPIMMNTNRRFFYTGADCVFFATAVLDAMRFQLLNFGSSILQRLTEHPAVHTFLPKMANQIQRELERRDEDGSTMEGSLSDGSIMAGTVHTRQQVLSFALPFHSDTDSRKHFQGRQLGAVYKNRETMKDSFLG